MDKDEIKKRRREMLENFSGIYPPYEAFYIFSIIYAAERTLACFDSYDEAVKSSADDSDSFSFMQEALTHAGALSRFFWPPGSTNELALARGKRLCESFELKMDSPLRQRELRNAFEHFDEKLDDYLLADLAGTFFPQPRIGDYTEQEEFDHFFKFLDPAKGICILLGEKFEFIPLRSEIYNILLRARYMRMHGSRLKPI